MSEELNSKEGKKFSSGKSFQWVEHSPVCTKVIDLDFNLHYMSAAGVKALGIDDIAEYYGKPYPFHIYPEPFQKIMRDSLNKVRETRKIIREEVAVLTTGGEKIWFHTTFVPINDERGELEYFIVVSMNITERKKIEGEIKDKIEELEKMNNLMTGREIRVIELKKEINTLLNEAGKPSRYAG